MVKSVRATSEMGYTQSLIIQIKYQTRATILKELSELLSSNTEKCFRDKDTNESFSKISDAQPQKWDMANIQNTQSLIIRINYQTRTTILKEQSDFFVVKC